MATQNRRIAAYLPPEIDQKLKAFNRSMERKFGSSDLIGDSAFTALSNFFRD